MQGCLRGTGAPGGRVGERRGTGGRRALVGGGGSQGRRGRGEGRGGNGRRKDETGKGRLGGEKGRQEQDPDQQTQPRVSVESSHMQLWEIM